MTKKKTYMLVSDYGYGDVSILEQDLTAEEAIAAWKERCQFYAPDDVKVEELDHDGAYGHITLYVCETDISLLQWLNDHDPLDV